MQSVQTVETVEILATSPTSQLPGAPGPVPLGRPEVRIDVLGAVGVAVGGQSRPVGAHKVRAMLAALALDAGRAVSTAELVEELWGGRPLGNPRNALQANAARLRKILDTPGGPSSLRSVGNGYLLDVPRTAVDANRFLDLAGQGAAELAGHPERARELLETALGLWRGPALLDGGDGLRCQAASAMFEERRLAAWEDLVSARLATGQERQAVAELRRLVAQHPLRERLCEQLMLALYRCGRQGDALELFRHTRRRLADELGLVPGRRLQQRHAEILSHDPALALPSAAWSGDPVRQGR